MAGPPATANTLTETALTLSDDSDIIDSPASPAAGFDRVDIVDEMKTSYLDYAMSVIVSRALPDVRDGLKPVHRRILFASQEGGFVAGRPYRKSAKIVGDVMGNYHPHGDSAIYDALARMTQDWSMRVPLIDGQGNFGSMDPDPPASMRYTEARLARVANSLLDDLDKDTVDFTPNYDGSRNEPMVLPARFPNLLVNGAGGIAVGMATNIPPHNLGEVIDACVAYLDNGAITTEELMQIVPDAVRTMQKNDPDLSNSVFLITGSTTVFKEIKIINDKADKVPVVSMIPEIVKAGRDTAVLAIGISFETNAHLAAIYGIDIIRSRAKASELKVGIVSPPDIAVSFLKAREIGLRVPFSFFETATFVYDYEGQPVRTPGSKTQ